MGRRSLVRVAVVLVVLIAGLTTTTELASAAGSYGQGNGAYDSYYANPSNPSTWSAFCSSAGDGASYSGVVALGVPACGPTPSTDTTNIYVGPSDQGGPIQGFQCVELAERYLWVKEGWRPINSTNGAQVVKNYATANSVPVVSNGATQAPAVGALMSFSSVPSFSDIGHVAIVTVVKVNSSGSGSVTITGENQNSVRKFSGFTDGTATMKVGAAAGLPAWTIKTFDSNSYIDWLDLPNSPPSTPPTVSNFTVTPSSLPATGGTVTFSAQVTNGQNCVLTVSRINYYDLMPPCDVTGQVSIPPNTKKKALIYKFKLAAAGTKTVKAEADVTVGSELGGGSGLTTISAGADTCGLLSGGTVKCTGDNDNGGLGIGTAEGPDYCADPLGLHPNCSTLPEAVSNLSGVAEISSGEGGQNCALLDGGTIDCWGDNFWGELGDGSTSGPQACQPDANGPVDPCSTVPVAVSGLTGVTQIVTGESDTCAIVTGGSVDCWGNNDFGELGDGTYGGPQICKNGSCSTTPVAVSGLSNVTSLAVGQLSACAVVSGGTVDCWGYDDGDLGQGPPPNDPDTCGQLSDVCSTRPIPVKNLSGAIAIADSGYSYCALLSGGTVDCWGEGASGQLGNGTDTYSWLPTPVPLTGVTAISGGGGGYCAILTGGGVDCWGYNFSGQLGDGVLWGPQTCQNATPCNTLPVAVSGLVGATEVSTGYDQSCALAESKIECWGNNSEGQLGIGTFTNSDVPITVNAFG